MTTESRRPSALGELNDFDVPNGTPYAAYYRVFLYVISGGSGSERGLERGLGLVLEIIHRSVNETFPQLMPSLYAGELATLPHPFDSIDANWLALSTLANSKTPVTNGAKLFTLPAVSGIRVTAPSGSPPAAPGRGQRRATSQTSAWATDSQRNPINICVSQDPTDPWV